MEFEDQILLGWPAREMSPIEILAHGPPTIQSLTNKGDLSAAIKHGGTGHLLTVAPTGAGKGTAAIIPNLLHLHNSTIVVDPKGENYAVTAEYRKSIGHNIYLLDPFDTIKSILPNDKKIPDSLNPFDLISINSTDPHEVLASKSADNAQMLATMIVAERSIASDPFWDSSATGLLTALIQYVGISEEFSDSRDFSSLVKMLFDDDFDYTVAVRIDQSKFDEFSRRHLTSYLAAPSDKTRPSISATARSHVLPLTTPSVLRSLSKSSFSLDEVYQGQKFTIYIVIPPDKLSSHRALLRLWIGVLLTTIVRRVSTPPSPTIMIIDECAQLGELKLLVQAVTLLRGYGLRVWMFFQDISQIRSIYPDTWEALVNNAAVFQTFGHSKQSSAAPIAELIGGYGPQEVARLPSGLQILSLPGENPRRAQLLKYFRDRVFAERASDNPYYATVKDIP